MHGIKPVHEGLSCPSFSNPELTFLPPRSHSTMSNARDSLFAARFPQGNPRWSSGYSGAPASSRLTSRPATIRTRNDATRTGLEAGRKSTRVPASNYPSRQGASPSVPRKSSTRSYQPGRTTHQSQGPPGPRDYPIEEQYQEARSEVSEHSAVTAVGAQSGSLTAKNLWKLGQSTGSTPKALEAWTKASLPSANPKDGLYEVVEWRKEPDVRDVDSQVG